jgi:hypothetical protein
MTDQEVINSIVAKERAAQATATSFVTTELTWLQKHEKMIIIFMVLLVALFIGNKYLNADAAKKDAAYAALAQKLDDQKAANDKQTAQTAAVTAQYQQMVDTLSRQNANLAGEISNRNTQLVQKQEQVKTMPLPQVAQEWETALNLPHGVLSVLSIAPTSISVPDSVARQTVTELEAGAIAQANLIDQTAISANLNSELGKSNEVISSQTVEIAGLNATIGLQDQTCKAQVAKVKADARKSKRNWFIAGYVGGFVSGIATRFFLKF